MIRVFDLDKKVELGTVLDGEGSINALEAAQSHVLSASANGASRQQERKTDTMEPGEGQNSLHHQTGTNC